MDVAEHRRWWRAEWLTRIQEMADLKQQRATWLNTRPRTWNPHFSFIGYTTTYLDYADRGGRVRDGLLSIVEAEIVSRLDDSVRTYVSPTNDFDHEAILRDERWLETVRTARSAQERLALTLEDEDERMSLLQPSEHAVEAAASADG